MKRKNRGYNPNLTYYNFGRIQIICNGQCPKSATQWNGLDTIVEYDVEFKKIIVSLDFWFFSSMEKNNEKKDCFLPRNGG